MLKKTNLPPEIQRILLEEYSFLREHSSVLLRFNRTLHYFKDVGVRLINIANTLKDEKEKIFEEIRGAKWLIAVVFSVAGIEQAIAGDPIITLLLSGAAFVLVAMDD